MRVRRCSVDYEGERESRQRKRESARTSEQEEAGEKEREWCVFVWISVRLCVSMGGYTARWHATFAAKSASILLLIPCISVPCISSFS